MNELCRWILGDVADVSNHLNYLILRRYLFIDKPDVCDVIVDFKSGLFLCCN